MSAIGLESVILIDEVILPDEGRRRGRRSMILL
jgi:hypothetical protein